MRCRRLGFLRYQVTVEWRTIEGITVSTRSTGTDGQFAELESGVWIINARCSKQFLWPLPRRKTPPMTLASLVSWSRHQLIVTLLLCAQSIFPCATWLGILTASPDVQMRTACYPAVHKLRLAYRCLRPRARMSLRRAEPSYWRKSKSRT